MRKVILCGDNDEYLVDWLRFKWKKAPEQLRHIFKALQIVSDSHKNEESVTWRDSCEKASNVLL